MQNCGFCYYKYESTIWLTLSSFLVGISLVIKYELASYYLKVIATINLLFAHTIPASLVLWLQL